jgi:hypothetical protein
MTPDGAGDPHDDPHDGSRDGSRDDPPEVDPFPGSPAAYARNWRQVLLTDAGVGVVFVASGVWAYVAWNEVIGGLVVALGVLYVFLVFRRYRTWAERRRAVGLD